MADEQKRSLKDEEIECDYRTDPKPLREAFSRLEEIEERLDRAGDSDTVEVPVEALRRLTMGMRIMGKSNAEMLGAAGGDRGDTGSHCDYNPFNRVNTGDFANIFG